MNYSSDLLKIMRARLQKSQKIVYFARKLAKTIDKNGITTA